MDYQVLNRSNITRIDWIPGEIPRKILPARNVREKQEKEKK